MTDIAPRPTPGEVIRFRRVAAGMTQEQLAIKMGLSSYTKVSDWERGRYKPEPKNAAKLRQVFGGDLEEYLGI